MRWCSLIEAIEKIIGRSYSIPLDSNGNYLLGVVGIDYSYIIGCFFLLVSTIFFIKYLFKFLESIFMLRR